MKKIFKFIVLSAVVAQLFICVNLAYAKKNHNHAHTKTGINYQHNHQCHDTKEDCKISSSSHENVVFLGQPREQITTKFLPILTVQPSDRNLQFFSSNFPQPVYFHKKSGLTAENFFSDKLRL